jgi:putative ABC transport system permease protein
MKPSPPHLALRFLNWFCREDSIEEIEGDLTELYEVQYEISHRKAKTKFIWHVLMYFRPAFIKSFKAPYPINRFAMLNHFLKMGLRNLFNKKAYSSINVVGLSLGMTVSILISLWIWDELSFNRFHQNYARIAQVMQNQNFNGDIQTWGTQAMQLGPELRKSYGGNFRYVIRASGIRAYTLMSEESILTRRGIFMEPAAPDMLSLKMLSGSRSGLNDPHSILISSSTAVALFGDENPMNRAIHLNNKLDVKVTGIYENLPPNTTFSELDFIAPWDLYAEGLPDWLGWGNSWFQTFVMLEDNIDFIETSNLIREAKLKNVGEETARMEPALFLHPMSKWHLYAKFEQGVNAGGRIQYVWLYGIIGGFVLLLACINFMNLSTARSENRSKEVGVRQAIGSNRRQLVSQFLVESLLVALVSFGLSLLFVHLLLPMFNQVAGKEIIMFWSSPVFWMLGIGFILFTGILAGSYPAFYLSSIRPIRALRGTFSTGRFSAIPRKVLVVVQFTVSISMIIGTILVFQQIEVSKSRSQGYVNKNLISVPIKTDDINDHFEAFRNELMQNAGVLDVSKSASPITSMRTTNSGFDWRGKDPDMQEEFVTLRISHEFGKTIGWEIKEGRDFSRYTATDSLGMILNEVAVKYMGFENPIGEIVKWGESETYVVVGVVRDMITQSPYAPIRPMIFFIDYDRSNNVNIRISENSNTKETLAKIKMVFKKHDPLNPFEFQFADQEYAKKFGNEERIGKLASFFTLLAIVISSLGLFGMASYIAEKRTKEIGIRKVMGASILSIWQLLSRDFVSLVILSSLIAAPVSYYFLNAWLQNYEYHTDIHWWIFIIAIAGALIATLLMVSFQAIKSATMKPVNSLRSE